MKLLKRFIVATAILLPLSQAAEARRGCCSHHGGVCSNQCCDGTALSAKCGGGEIQASVPKLKSRSKADKKVNEKLFNGIQKKAS